MPSAIRVIDRAQDLADWDHGSFADAELAGWNATDGKYKSLGQHPARKTFTCPSSVGVRELVRISGSDEVDWNNASDSATGDAFGIVESKPTATTAVVVSLGPVSGFSGLVPEQRYWADTSDGALTLTPPNTTGHVVQQIGKAVTATMLNVSIHPRVLL